LDLLGIFFIFLGGKALFYLRKKNEIERKFEFIVIFLANLELIGIVLLFIVKLNQELLILILFM
jgi:hypothetical protein